MTRRRRGVAARSAFRNLLIASNPTDAARSGRHLPWRERFAARVLRPGTAFRVPLDRLLAPTLRHQLSGRFALHLVVGLLTLILSLGEMSAAWSLQTVAPWQERAAPATGGSAPEEVHLAEQVAPVLPQTALSGRTALPEAGALEVVAPAILAPRPVVAAFRAPHILAPDETLGELAERYAVTLESLIWANGLQNGDVLAVGQELRVPQVSGVTYVIQPGDTLDRIAAQLGVAPEAIALFAPNGVTFDAPLPVGQEVFVPGGVLPLPERLLALRGGIAGLAAATAQPAGVVQQMQTNLREGPGQVYTRLAYLETGRRAQLLARHENWLKVDVAGTTGWVRADLLLLPAGLFETLPETKDFPPPPPIWVWPTRGTITSYFGPRWGSFHNGIDIANRAWTPIVAARAGRVVEAGWCSGYGYCVKINHDGGIQTIYGHLIDQPVVSAGDDVVAGQLIGYMGSTYDRRGGGYSTGVHLHFTITVNGRAVNPLKFLP